LLGPVLLVTGWGFAQTQNYIAKFGSSGNTVNSSIFDNGNVGIGTTSPSAPLDLNGYLHVSGNTNPPATAQGAYITWNIYSGSTGETDFVNNNGGSSGGFAFFNTPVSGTPKTALMVISGDGNTTVNGRIYSVISNPDIGGAVALVNPAKTTPGTASQWLLYNMSGGYGNSLQFWAYDNASCGGGGLCESRLTLMDNGNVGIGTISPSQRFEVVGNAKVDGALYFGDGTVQSTAWTGTLCGGDYAESVDVSGDRAQYGPGDVLRIDDDNPSKFVRVAEAYSTAVAGVYSTKPGALGRRQTTPKSVDEIPLAMIGIVPVKVSTENGRIRPHDLLVSSSKPGYAMKGTDRSRLVGAVIGKAMGSLDSGNGVIEVLVTLQ
jgi:hypothetical protein